MKKNKCSGTFCEMQYPYDVENCELYESCKNYMPLADMSGTEEVIKMTMELFDIHECERKKLEILFNAYVSQWQASMYRLTPIVNVRRNENPV